MTNQLTEKQAEVMKGAGRLMVTGFRVSGLKAPSEYTLTQDDIKLVQFVAGRAGIDWDSQEARDQALRLAELGYQEAL